MRRKKKKEERKKGFLRDWIETLAVALALALIVRTFVVQAFKIPSGSMLDTLHINDYILVNKFKYKLVEPKRGEIIVFKSPTDPQKDFIKRLIALPGETIEIRKKRTLINGKYISEPYKVHKDPHIHPRGYGHRDYYGPVKVPENCYFVMGDNRDNSNDSRTWKFLPKKYLKGKAFLIYWPPWRIRIIK
jgi:signal peptidase I